MEYNDEKEMHFQRKKKVSNGKVVISRVLQYLTCDYPISQRENWEETVKIWSRNETEALR